MAVSPVIYYSQNAAEGYCKEGYGGCKWIDTLAPSAKNLILSL